VRPTWIAIFIGIMDILLGAVAAGLAYLANEPILYIGIVPLALVFTPIGVIEIVRALNPRQNATR
jgi:hypothetical protein